MSDFSLWFTTGMQHILDLRGYDHILYVVALCIMYSAREWKNLLLLITAFTIGHSVTLACSALHLISVKQSLIEVLIPCTIICTCLFNIINRNKPVSRFSLNYFLALLFGFIHGMGFSYLLRSMLGKEESVVFPLLSFNLGLEAGQLVIVAFMLLISVFLTRFTNIRKSAYVLSISPVILLVSLYLLFNRFNDL
jgi:hydrogenase/urease accessory protein HupE